MPPRVAPPKGTDPIHEAIYTLSKSNVTKFRQNAEQNRAFVAKHGEAFRRQAHRLGCHATHMKGYVPGGN